MRVLQGREARRGKEKKKKKDGKIMFGVLYMPGLIAD